MNNISDRGKYILNLEQYNNLNTPEEVGMIDVEIPDNQQHILRCLIRDTFGEFQIPENLLWCKPIIEAAENYQRNVIGVRHSFCYVTVRSGEVESVTDDEWHLDGFSQQITHIPEQNYVWTNILPTEYIEQKISFPSDFDPYKHNIHKYIQDNLDSDTEIKVCEEKKIYCMDPYVIHRRPDIPEGIKRTFIRVGFIPIEIDDVNNTQNPLLPRIYTRDGVTSFRDKLLKYIP